MFVPLYVEVSNLKKSYVYPACACASRDYAIGAGVHIYVGRYVGIFTCFGQKKS